VLTKVLRETNLSLSLSLCFSTETQCAPPERGHVCLFAIKKIHRDFSSGPPLLLRDRYFAQLSLSLMALKMQPESNNGA
jgi:hypothetical protein